MLPSNRRNQAERAAPSVDPESLQCGGGRFSAIVEIPLKSDEDEILGRLYIFVHLRESLACTTGPRSPHAVEEYG